jgi:hypothetical protein
MMELKSICRTVKKNYKTAGADSIAAELLINDSPQLVYALGELAWTSETLSES